MQGNGNFQEKIPKYLVQPPICPSLIPKEERGEVLLQQWTKRYGKNNDFIPNIHFITYANEKFKESKERIKIEAGEFWKFSSIFAFGPSDLASHVHSFFKELFYRNKGAGYWIWKFFIIRETLENVEFGDFVLYLDAGSTINKKGRKRFFEYLKMLNMSKSGILSIAENNLERSLTSGRILETFDILENESFLDSKQYWAGMLLIQKRENVINLFDSILRIVHWDMWILSDRYRNYKSANGFRGNRHDQSLLSVARKCHGSVVVDDDIDHKNAKNPFWATRIRV